MSADRMLDLEIERLADGAFELRQQDGSPGEPCRILLHPVQVRLLAERAGLLTPDPTPRMSAAHQRRLRSLDEKLEWLYKSGYIDQIIDRCGYGIEISLHIEAITDLVGDMIEDIGTAAPAATVTSALPEAVTECHEKSTVISVTPSKRGRPAKDDALTPAERQARHRAKQAEVPRQNVLAIDD